jgi:dolichol-phosphate mannosyltransferase
MISIVTPTYNEKDGITHFVETISQTMKGLKQPFEIVVVDDNSPDGTASIVTELKKIYPALRLLKRKGKLGIGSAYSDGFSAAKGDYIIGIDADLSPGVGVISAFLKRLEAGDGMVIGSRYLSDSQVRNVTEFKTKGSKLFNVVFRFFLGLPLSDLTHSNRAFSKKAWQAIAPRIQTKDHPSFFIECSFWAKKLGFAVSEVPIVFTERVAGRSKLNVWKGLRNALKTIARLRFA